MIKRFHNETWEGFCIRILSSYKDFGLTRKEAYFMLFNDNNKHECEMRKRSYLAKDILSNKEIGEQKFPQTQLENIKKDSLLDINGDDLLLESNQKLRKQVQKLRDENRLIRAEYRSDFRISNTLDNMFSNAMKIADNYKKPLPIKVINRVENGEKIAVLQVSDVHFGKVVNLPHNKYNLEIARERLFKYTKNVIDELNMRKISKVHMLLLGDLFQLTTHGSILTNEDVRASCFISGFDSICEMIDTFLELDFEISVGGVLGNESRIDDNNYFSNVSDIAKDNFDYILFQMVKRRYKDELIYLNESDKIEEVIDILGKSILITHGNFLKHNNLKDSCLNACLRHFEHLGKLPSFTLMGHIHEAVITPTYARNSSLVGSDEFSNNSLNIPMSDISQNLHIVSKDDIISFKINCK